jgi:hypothetical protein
LRAWPFHLCRKEAQMAREGKGQIDRLMERLSRKLPDDGRRWEPVRCTLDGPVDVSSFIEVGERRLIVAILDGVMTLCVRRDHNCQHIAMPEDLAFPMMEKMARALRLQQERRGAGGD